MNLCDLGGYGLQLILKLKTLYYPTDAQIYNLYI